MKKRKKSQTTKNTKPNMKKGSNNKYSPNSKRVINSQEIGMPSMDDMDKALQNFKNSTEVLHLFIFGETGTRSWTFDPKQFTFNPNEDKEIELELKSKGLALPTDLGELVNFIGYMLDEDRDDKFSEHSTLNQYIGYCALKQFLTTETYRSGLVFNMNTGVTSYLRMKPVDSTLFDYQSRFHGMTKSNGTTLELTKQAFGFETKILFRVHKNEYKYSPMAKIIMA